MKALLKDEKPAYIRVGRNAVDPVYEEGRVPFEMDKATVVTEGKDAVIVACGEMVKPAADAAKLLEAEGNPCHRFGYVLCEAFGQRCNRESSQECEIGGDGRRALTVWRPGFHGEPGGSEGNARKKW